MRETRLEIEGEIGQSIVVADWTDVDVPPLGDDA